MYSPSRYDIQSEWRHYTVRVDKLYSQSGDTNISVQVVDTNCWADNGVGLLRRISSR